MPEGRVSGRSAATSIDGAEHGATLKGVMAAREAADQNQYKVLTRSPVCGPDRRAHPCPDRLSERGACDDTDRGQRATDSEARTTRATAHDRGQTNQGVSDPAVLREGRARARQAGSLTPWFVRCREHKPRSRAAQRAARSSHRDQAHRFA